MDMLFGELGFEFIKWLQNLGTRMNNILDHFFQTITVLGDELFFLLMIALMFWCVSKRLAIQLGLVLGFSYYINVLSELLRPVGRSFLRVLRTPAT